MFKKFIPITLILALCLFSSARAANIIFVGEDSGDDTQWTAVLDGSGYTVNYVEDYWQSLDSGKIAQLEAADLIIVLNSCNSGNYDDGPEEQQWNAITTPLLLQNVNISRSSRWQFLNSTTRNDYDDALLEAVVPSHAVFNGVALDASNQVDISDESIDNIRVNGGEMGNGTVLGTEATSGDILLAEWAPGVPYYDGSMTPGGPRMLFLGVAQDGQCNLNAEGKKLYLNIIKYLLGFNSLAQQPSPASGENDVLLGTTLSWKPGQFASTHNVFFGTDISNVTDATVSDPLGTTLSAGQDANTFDPGSLAYGTTYYWRVDEINAPSAPAEYKGNVWSFTAEMVAYALGTSHVTATGSTAAYGDEQDPNSTCNGAGIDDSNDTHSTERSSMWLATGSGVPGDSWIQYEFDQVYDVHDMLVWNYNEAMIGPDFGAKDVTVAYSLDGQSWTDLPGPIVLNKATGDDTCTANTTVTFGGEIAKYVKITFNTSWGGMFPFYGLSEVRFMVVPTYATEPSPDDGAQDVSIDTTLSWRPGRGVVEHDVYLSTDEAAVATGTADVQTVSQSNLGPMSLDIQSTYYWRVDEVNSLAEYTTWSGEVWSFTTADSVIVDDFEDYNNTPPSTVYDTWKDGLTVPAYGGSQMGHFSAPFAETSIVHGGSQAAPVYYDNTTATKSEVVANTSALPIGSNWALGGAQTLVIWFQGSSANASTDQIYAKINSTKVVYDGPASDISRTAWTKWEIPLAGISVNNVSTITVGVEKIGATGGSGILYLDDIVLTNVAAPVDPGTSNLIAKYDMENNVQDSSGNNLNGTANGDPTYQPGKAGKGNAIVLDGTNDYVDLPIGPAISTLTDCTISVWVNWSGQGGIWQRVYDFGNGPPTNMWLCPDTGSNMRFVLKPNDALGEFAANTSSIEASNWQHVAAVIKAGDPNTISLYLNGDLVATNNNLRALPRDMGETPQNWIGRSQYSADPYFNGMVDDLRIYDRALSAAEVKYLSKN